MTPENRKTFETWLKAEGIKLYATFDAKERRILQYGMFPAQKVQAAQRELHRQFEQQEGRPPNREEQRDIARLLAVGCMQAADAGPEPLVV